MSKLALQITARMLLCAWVGMVCACALVPRNPLSGAHSMDSFMGVHFGDALGAVMRQYPLGIRETSPYGAPAYKLENVNSNGIDYPAVTYEFTDSAGMQMVYARFAASQSADVYQQLQTTLGTPVSVIAAGEGPARVEASWQLSDGSTVFFNGSLHRWVLLSKDGASLKADIPLRDSDVGYEVLTSPMSSLGRIV